jgi:hypothetical protein
MVFLKILSILLILSNILIVKECIRENAETPRRLRLLRVFGGVSLRADDDDVAEDEFSEHKWTFLIDNRDRAVD